MLATSIRSSQTTTVLRAPSVATPWGGSLFRVYSRPYLLIHNIFNKMNNISRDPLGYLKCNSAAVLRLVSNKSAITSVTSAYTIVLSDNIINATSGTFTITLPTAAGILGKKFIVKNSGTGAITLDAFGSETIDGAATEAMPAQYDAVTVVSDGVNWIEISRI